MSAAASSYRRVLVSIPSRLTRSRQISGIAATPLPPENERERDLLRGLIRRQFGKSSSRTTKSFPIRKFHASSLTSLAEKDNKPAEEENQNGEENPEKEREKKEDVSSAETPPGDETTETAENTEAASKGSDADVAAAEEEAADSGATDDGDDFDPTKVTYAFTEPPPLSEASQQKIDAIFKKILWLDMIEVHLLTQVVNENLGISWKETEQGMRGGGVGGASKAGAADGAAAEEPAAAKTIFDLKLVGFDAKAKIKVIKEVRTIAGLGLKEAKELVESAPKVIQKDLKQDKAEELKAQLEAVGAEVELA